MTATGERMRRISAFVLVGALGFAVDAGLTEALVALGMAPLAARLVALAAAISATFALNSRVTFRSQASGLSQLAEFGRYGLANAVALAVNYAVFALVITLAPGSRPALAVAAGSAVAMTVSYVGYDRFVFRRTRG